MIRIFKIGLLACLLLLGIVFQSHAEVYAIASTHSECIQPPDITSVQHSTTPVQKNSLLFWRFHQGIDKWYTTLFIPCQETQPDLVIQNSLYKASHHLWSMLSVHKELPRYFDFYFSCSLRAPPVC